MVNINKLILGCLFSISVLEATPTTLFWTTCTTDITTENICVLNIDNAFEVYNVSGHNALYPPSVGFEFGLPKYQEWEGEAGFEYLAGEHNPWIYNIKVGIQKPGELFEGSPSFNVGLFNMGFGRDVNFNVIEFILGQQIFTDARMFIAAYAGNKSLGKNRVGFMVGADYSWGKDKLEGDDEEFFRWTIGADYSSGKNYIGGGGLGLTYRFTRLITLQTGPVFFNSTHYLGRWKLSTQVNLGFEF